MVGIFREPGEDAAPAPQVLPEGGLPDLRLLLAQVRKQGPQAQGTDLQRPRLGCQAQERGQGVKCSRLSVHFSIWRREINF